MIFRSRHFSTKLISAINKINNANIKPELSLSGRFTFVNNLMVKRYFCKTYEDSTSLNYDVITNGDKNLEHKLKVLELELDVMRQEGLQVPAVSAIPVNRWQELLTLPSRSARLKLYMFLFSKMKAKENDKKKKLEKAQKREEEREELPKDLPFEEFVKVHRLGYNHIFLRIYEATMNQFYNNKLIQAVRFGEKLVIDCGYEKYMTTRENMNCAKQIMLLFADNRLNVDPFDIHLCNVNKNGGFMKDLAKYIPTLYEPWFPLHVHEKSYLDVFPKEKLIYLTPHCNEVMEHYEPDVMYILGGIVDKSNNEPLSLAKAKKEGVRMAKLPLDKYLDWGLGGKSLTINQMVNILLDIKNTGDWDEALKHVPQRKLVKENSLSKIWEQRNRWRPNNPTQSISDSLRFDSEQKNYKKELKNKHKFALSNIMTK